MRNIHSMISSYKLCSNVISIYALTVVHWSDIVMELLLLSTLRRILPADGQVQYIMSPSGPMILIPSSNGHLAMPAALATAPFQWLPQVQQQQQAQPMEVTVTTVATNNNVAMTTTPKKTQPLFIAVSSTPQTQTQQQEQQQTTIDSFNEKHRDVEEHFKRSLALLHSSSSASSLPSSKDSVQVNANTVTNTQATSTPIQPTLFMPTVQTTQVANATPLQQQHVTTQVANATPLQQQHVNMTVAYAPQQKETVTEVSGHTANAEVSLPTPTKPQNVINNPLNVENLIRTSTPNAVTVQPSPVASSQHAVFDPSGHEQQQTKSADVQVTTNPFPAIFLAPGGMYPQTATPTAAAAAGLNYTPFISMDPNLLGTMLVSQSQLAAAQANQAALLQPGNLKLTNDDLIKMVQAHAASSAATTPAGSTSENSDSSNAVMTMLLQRAGVKPVYVVDNAEGGQQLRTISGSNIVAMATTMNNGSTNTSNTLSTQNSSSQIVPTPMNTDDGQAMETSQPATQERRSVHSDISSISEQVEDHFARALGDNWQLTQKY